MTTTSGAPAAASGRVGHDGVDPANVRPTLPSKSALPVMSSPERRLVASSLSQVREWIGAPRRLHPQLFTRATFGAPAMTTPVRFWVDPLCPFCWATAQWIRGVAPERDLEISWQPISLLVKNETQPDSPWYDISKWSFGLLRVLEQVRAEEGEAAVDALYLEYGRRIHHDKETLWDVSLALKSVDCRRTTPLRSTTSRSTPSCSVATTRRSRSSATTSAPRSSASPAATARRWPSSARSSVRCPTTTTPSRCGTRRSRSRSDAGVLRVEALAHRRPRPRPASVVRARPWFWG